MSEVRSVAKRDAHRASIAEMTLKGRTQSEIAESLDISAATVARDLAWLRAEWREQAQVAITEQRAIEIAKLNNLERIRWDAWDDTKDPRHLDGVERCIAQRREIFGIDAPKKIAPTTPDGLSEYDPIARARELFVGKLTSLFAAVGATAISTDHSGSE